MTTAIVRCLRSVVVWLGVLVAAAQPAAARPTLEPAARSGRIVVYAEPGLERPARRLAGAAEATLTRIAGDLAGLRIPPSIEVRLVRDARDLASVAPAGRGAPAWAVGVAYPDAGVISVALRRGNEVLDADATLRHELGHAALGAALGPKVPRWLHEGFANQHAADWSWSRTETLAGMSWFGGIVPIEDLDRSFPAEESPAHRAYAQSYDFVGFLTRRGRWPDKADDGDRWPFRRFLADLARGNEVDAAARHAYGASLRQLFDEWKSDLGTRYMLLPIGLLGLALWILVALLLALAWRRRRKQNRARLAEWEAEERARRTVAPPPYVAWPGVDPFAEPERPDTDPAEAADERRPDPDPQLLN